MMESEKWRTRIKTLAVSACPGDRSSLAAIIAGTGDFSNAYDADQRPTMIQQGGVSGGDTVSQKEIDRAYNAIGQFTGVVDNNYLGVGPRIDVLAGAYSYDNDARLTGIAYTSNAGKTTIDTFGWGYNAGSLVTSFTSSDGTADYGYDPTNQLTSAAYTTAVGGHQPTNESFSFDANGNRTMTGYTTGSGNLLTSDGTFNYQHDADGNTTVRTRISNTYATDYRTMYTWDYRNRLTDVDYYDNNSVLTKHVHYVYGVFNNLIGEEDDDTGDGVYDHEEFYVVAVSPQTPAAGQTVVEGAQPLLEFNGGGALVVRYLGSHALDEVTSLSQGGAVYWTAVDGEGSVRDIVDNSGNLLDHLVYSAFGQVAYQSNSATPHWAGYAAAHESPGTSLLISGARWYDPATGRWLSADPSGFSGGDTNTQRYAGNGPTNGVDPTGLGLITWIYTGAWNATPRQYEAAVAAAGGYYLNYAGETHQALGAVAASGPTGQLLATPVAATLTLLEGEQLHEAVMANAIANAAQPAVAPQAREFNNLVTDHFAEAITYAQYVEAVHNLTVLANSPCPVVGCFVAGTLVWMGAGGDGAFDAARSFDRGGESYWLGSLLIAGIGFAAYQAGRAKRKNEEEEARLALASLFNDDSAEPDPDDTDSIAMTESAHRDWGECAAAVFSDTHYDAHAHDSSAPTAVSECPLVFSRRSASCLVRRGSLDPSPAAPVTRRRRNNSSASRGASSRPKRRPRVGLAVLLLLALWLGLSVARAPRGGGGQSPSTVSMASTAPPATRPIETIRVGLRVLGENPDLAESQHTTQTSIDPATWRLVKLHAEQHWDDGTLDTIEVQTLQSPDWLQEHRAHRGAFVPLPIDFTEMGLPEDLRAKVEAIERCPEIADGPGHVVMSTVSHLNRLLFDLDIVNSAGRMESVTTTGYHKFYSASRSGWVSASELSRGEQLRGADGPLTVQAVTHVPGVERVYNFSVEGEHVYHVSELGALVHNEGCTPAPDSSSDSSGSFGSGSFLDNTPSAPATPNPDDSGFNLSPLVDDDDLGPYNWSQIIPPDFGGSGPGPGPWNNPVK